MNNHGKCGSGRIEGLDRERSFVSIIIWLLVGGQDVIQPISLTNNYPLHIIMLKMEIIEDIWKLNGKKKTGIMNLTL